MCSQVVPFRLKLMRFEIGWGRPTEARGRVPTQQRGRMEVPLSARGLVDRNSTG